jgi:hypothetical protein
MKGPMALEDLIHVIRGRRVMFDADLASLYEVPTKALNQALRRNLERFPEDFAFQISKEDLEYWRSRTVTSNPGDAQAYRGACRKVGTRPRTDSFRH